MYAIMGITGRVGGAVASALLSSGSRVRGIVRDRAKGAQWKERGAEVAVADYNDAAALSAAFSGMDGVFVMLPPNFTPAPGFPEAKQTLTAIYEALAKARTKKAVYLSSIGSEQKSGLGLIMQTRMLEMMLSDLPIQHIFLRAGWFMENFAGNLASARAEGKVYSYLQPLDRRVPMVATVDIGKAGAEVLCQDSKGTRYIEVAGPRDYSPLDVAQGFSEVLGRKVEAVVVPREEWIKSFVAQGMPEDRTGPFAEMLDGFNSGLIHFGASGTENYVGVTELSTVLKGLAGAAQASAA
ncbi:MAG TPA: NmrA family NAD(P)-binding protein [Candidatus Dormibacteraeota bacterium]|nr:NmrA family NAD(P)-binding protein [Candidatus Dormibacteraeota bacterium]